MLFSCNWLREINPVKAGPDRIAEALTARGLTVDAVDQESAPGDVVLDIDIPANRPDCLGHYGIAREVAAAFDVPLPPPRGLSGSTRKKGGGSLEELVSVRIESPELCARYTARLVREVKIGPSPKEVTDRLIACGLRPINNVVDISNIVLLETGHPIHTFDYRLVDRGRIVIRTAGEAMPFTTLDQVKRKLEPDMLVIADNQRPVALAGVMGGADSEIGDDTTDVLIEAAWFDPVSIRRTARRLGLSTDASHRFERGMDPEGVVAAQGLAVQLLEKLAGGKAVPGMVDSHPAPVAPVSLELRYARVQRLLGYDPGRSEIRNALAALHLAPQAAGEDRLITKIPSYRVDLTSEADLVEEVARHLGLDRLPSTLPLTVAPAEDETVHPLAERTRDILAGLGFQEAFNYSMLPEGADREFVPEGTLSPMPLSNPIAEQLAFLRRSILPGLVQSVDLNLRRGNRDVRLFELGRVFIPQISDDRRPREPMRAGLAWSGLAEPRHWSREDRPVDAIDLSGAVTAALSHLRPGLQIREERSGLSCFHPGQAICWKSKDGVELAWSGRLHPQILAVFDLPQDLFLAEIELDAVLAAAGPEFKYRPIPKVPAVSRDLSLVLGQGAGYRQVVDLLASRPAPAPATFEAVDRYIGSHVAEGETALTIRVTLERYNRTLTDEETERYRLDLIEALELSDLPVKLRAAATRTD